MNVPLEIHPTESQLLKALPFCEGGISPKNAPPICTVCSKHFKNRGSMYFHMKKRHGSDFVGAEEEDGTLDATFGVTATANGGAMRFFCPVDGCCRRGEGPGRSHFASAKLLVQHFQKKHSEKKHRCSECSARFALARDLRYHQKKLCPGAKGAQKSVPFSESHLSQMGNDATEGCRSPRKVFLIPLNFGQKVRFRRILPRIPIERRTVATQTEKCQCADRTEKRTQKCVASQIDAQFGLGTSSFANAYSNFPPPNGEISSAFEPTPQIHRQMHKNQQNLPNEFLRFQSVQCQTNFHPKSTGAELGAQCSTSAAVVSPFHSFSPLSSHIYLPPLLTSSSTQTAAQMRQNQCSQTTADPPSASEPNKRQTNDFLLQTQNTASTQTYLPPPADHRQLLLAHGPFDSDFFWMDEATMCASVSAQTDLSWTAALPMGEWPNIGEIGQR